MHLYLVRHGLTGDNKANKAAAPSSPLHSLGIKQAMSAGARLEGITFNKIFVSDALRAQQTAEHIIVHHNKTEVVTTPLLAEYKKPKEMHGLVHDSDEAQKMYKEIEKHMEERDWHFSDEENYYDFRGRVLDFLKIVEKESGVRYLAVTHSLVIRLLTCLIVFGKDLSATDFQKARWNLKISNAGITVLSKNEDVSTSGWELLTFNDIAHLAE